MSYREPQEGDCLVCPELDHTVDVSVEDPDASVSGMLDHLAWDHGLRGIPAAQAMAKVKLVDKKGQVIPA